MSDGPQPARGASVLPRRPGTRALCSPYLLPFICHGRAREQGWSEAPCTRAPSPPPLAPAACLEPSETAPQGGALLPGGWGGQETVWFVTSSKGEAEHRPRRAGRLVTMTGPGTSYILWSSAQEPGPFLPHTSMPRSWGPEHVAKAPHVPCHSPDHPGGDVA